MEDSNNSQAADQARARRTQAHIPISIGDDSGFVRDFSVTGMFLVQDRLQNVGSNVQFTVNLKTPVGLMKFACEGEVVRIEENCGKNGQIGIGIKIISQFGRQLLLDNLPHATAGASAAHGD